MISRILEFSLRQRGVVLLGVAVLLGAGLWSALHLPIDAVLLIGSGFRERSLYSGS
jgi:heavy metal efflux system protein